MTTPEDFTTRARDEMFNIYSQYQALVKRITDLSDEVTANGGVTGLYGAAGAKFPVLADGFTFTAMVAACQAIVSLAGAPTAAQKNAIIVCRR